MARFEVSHTTVAALCIALLFGGLVLDLSTEQQLVVAIMYAIPIALSGLSSSEKLTWSCVGLALLANAGAGWANTTIISPEAVDNVAIANRGFAALSFCLVGVLTLVWEKTSDEVEELHSVGQDYAREHDLREMLVALSGPLGHDALVAAASRRLRRLLQADAVVVSALDDDRRFAQPQWLAPSTTKVGAAGSLASWAVDSLPNTSRPVIGVRSDEGLTVVGRWRAEGTQELLVLIARPDRPRAAQLLSDALAVLEALRTRAMHLDGVLAGDREALEACACKASDVNDRGEVVEQHAEPVERLTETEVVEDNGSSDEPAEGNGRSDQSSESGDRTIEVIND